MTTTGAGTRYLYLDMTCWVQMARGLQTKDARWTEAATALECAARAGTITIPLSASNYLELWHRSNTASREQIGSLMRDLSGYATLLEFSMVQRLEIEAFVATWVGDERRVLTSDLIGWGASHAFSATYGRLRFVENIESQDQPEGPPAPPPPDLDQLRVRMGVSNWEWFQLVGVDGIEAQPELDRTPEHRYGSQDEAEENRIRALLITDPGTMKRLDDLTRFQELVQLTDTINRICIARRVDPYGLFHETMHPAGIAGAVREFGQSVPTVHVKATLRAWKHRDFTHPWDQHDRTDLRALSLAVPYCDWVVTERRWAHLAKASGLSAAYATTVGSGLSALEGVLSELAAP